MGEMKWREMFYPDTPLLEIVLRGTVTYLAIFALLRLVLRRESSGLGITDVLVVVLIADAAQNGMSGGYQSLADGVVLVGVIVFWAWALDWLAFRYPAFARLVRPPKLQLVEDGRPLWRNMAREFVTIEELRSALREQGIADLEQVRAAFMEPDGTITGFTDDSAPQGTPT